MGTTSVIIGTRRDPGIVSGLLIEDEHRFDVFRVASKDGRLDFGFRRVVSLAFNSVGDLEDFTVAQ